MVKKELVILVGMQGAGKTRYCKTVLRGHARICQDEGPRTFNGIVSRCRQLLEQGVRKIVIDRTNPARFQRQMLEELARQFGYRVRIVYFDVPSELCLKRIKSRRNHPTLGADQMHQAVAGYLSRLELPTEDECDELVTRKK